MKLEKIVEEMEATKGLEFIPTGFSKLDNFLDGGLMKKEMVIIGGASGSGKSYLAGQMMFNVASKGFKCKYFSLEISGKMIVSRLIGSLANIKPTRLLAGLLTPEEFGKMKQSKNKVLSYSEFLDIEDSEYLLNKIIAKLKVEKPDFVIVDFIQNVLCDSQSEYDRMSRISLELQKLAKEINCCIVCLSQLSNRSAREGTENTVVEFKGSGVIAQICDLGFWIQREGQGIKLMLRKNRRGISNIFFNLSTQYPGGLIEEAINA